MAKCRTIWVEESTVCFLIFRAASLGFNSYNGVALMVTGMGELAADKTGVAWT